MSHDQIFNLEEALDRVEHDHEILHTMAELFLEHGPKDLDAIKEALAAHDSASVARAAHRLKGAVMQFCAPAAHEAVQTIEEAGKAGDLTRAMEVCVQLENELPRLVAALRRLKDGGLAA